MAAEPEAPTAADFGCLQVLPHRRGFCRDTPRSVS
jgi:hypothetical protein